MKNTIKYILQKTLGFERYLYTFSKFKIRTLRNDKNERDFFHFLKLIDQNEGVVLDIGANIGIMTYYMASNFPSKTVHSFEPVPANFSVLQKIVNRFKLTNVILHPFALGSESTVLKMVLPYNGKTKMQGLSHIKHDSIQEWNQGEEFDVPVKTLDQLFPTQQIQAIKIDIENFEYFAFLGGKALLKRCQPIVYSELWDNENRYKCFDLLTSIGYSIYVVEENKLVPFQSGKHITQNFIFKIDRK